MAQYALPIADISKAGGGTPATQCAGDGDANAFDELDEGFGAGRGSGSGPDDATSYWHLGIQSPGGVDVAWIECLLTSITDPTVHTSHVARMRRIKTSNCTPSASGQQIDTTIQVRQGTTVIASNTAVGIDETWTTQTLTLSEAQAANITNYTDLRIRVYHDRVGGGAGRHSAVSACELEVPDAPAGGATIMAQERSKFRRINGRLFSRVN